MDDSITVPQRAVSPPAAHGALPSPREDAAALFFALKETEMFQTKSKQTNKQTVSCRNAPSSQ